MTTDIAFVVGFLALLGSRVPFGLKILLLTLAIVDDIGAILVIAVAYTANTSLMFLIIGMASFGVIYLFRWIGVRLMPVSAHISTRRLHFQSQLSQSSSLRVEGTDPHGVELIFLNEK